MSSKNKLLVCAAVAGLSVGMVSAASAAEVNCWGVNSCGGISAGKDKAQCAVDAKQVEAAKKEFGDKYAKATAHKCGAEAKCAGKGGNLNWTKVKSKEECKTLGGFLMNKEGKIEKL
ncbi:hypothetical protein [Silvanigrella sp.]|jgi:hypothetical protein|uniref:hypothetical protein n=1 Tax=Silvanigrella sp. TaxID=2024976 RepID=UPI0037C56409